MAEHGGSNDHVVALGGGRGLACVLSALRSANSRLTVITSIAADEDWEGDARQGLTGPVGDLRRSLEALSDEDAALLHAIRRPLTVDGVGQHPLGDLTLAAAADVLGSYGRASMWLGDQLGIDGAVLPATIEPARCRIEEIVPKPPAEAKGQPGRAVRGPLRGRPDRLAGGCGRRHPERTVGAADPGGVVQTHPFDLRGARPRWLRSPTPPDGWSGSRTSSPTGVRHRT
jgi:hypothetical protein